MTSARTLHILPLSKGAEDFYSDHGTFHEGDSGLDLFLIEDKMIRAGETVFVKLGIKAAAYDENSENVSFLVMARSSIAKTPLRLSNSLGLIDAGYRGEMMICLDNIKSTDYEVKKGDRLAQAVFFDGKPFSLKIVDQLSETSRGECGWGSTTKESNKTDVEADEVQENAKTSKKDENEVPSSKKRTSETELEVQVKKKTTCHES